MNIAVLKGRFTRDPEVKYSQKSKAYVNFSLGVPDSFYPKDKDKTFWANCLAWGKTAEIVGKYCSKGMEVVVEGHINSQKYTKDGVEAVNWRIVVNKIYFCGSATNQPKGEDIDIPF